MDYKFNDSDLEDLGSEDSGGSSNVSTSSLLSGLMSLPVTLVALITFFEKSSTVAAVEGVFGVGAFSTAVIESLWVVGALITGMIGIVIFLIITSLILALVKRSLSHLFISILGGVWIGLSYGLSEVMFSSLPVVAGFVLASNLLVYGGLLLTFLLSGVVGLFLME